MQSPKQDSNAWRVAASGQRHGVPQDSASGTKSRDSRKRKDPPTTRETLEAEGPRRAVVEIPYLRLQESDYTSYLEGKATVSAKGKGDSATIPPPLGNPPLP